MNKIQFKDVDIDIKEAWLSTRKQQIAVVLYSLIQVSKMLTITKDKHRWLKYNLEEFAPELYWYLSSQTERIPTQSMIGAIASIINTSGCKLEKTVIDAHQTAGEIVLGMTKFISTTTTYTNSLMSTSLLGDTELNTDMLYPLPKNYPAETHRALGSYKWNLTETESLEQLNKLEFTMLDIPEDKPTLSSKSNLDQIEKYKKYLIRSITKSNYINKPMFFKWSSDYRGRTYSEAYHYNPQGSEYEKSIITIKQPIKVTLEGRRELSKAIASAYGLGKKTDAEKLEWYHNNKDKRTSTGMKKGLIPKEPYTAKRLQLALKQIAKTGYSNITIEHDATNSQLQVISVLTGDLQTAKTCNVVPAGDYISDAYQLTADMMTMLALKAGITE